ncbi:uncharacterized protein LOC120940401 [Rana temporaria]|uniref:uncharacterized protein LOC120940401 n=1 Tax=Rana temporaria TaxID=8407 RepID=UPI001AAC62B6|nr:uncharacterized protein LOC120940401 [Rana temporaria]
MLQRLRETDPVMYLQFLERQAEREERRAEREAAQREADRRHELEMTRLQQQRQVQNPGSLEHRDAALPVAPAAKFPVMEKDSDIDVYLLSFEKTCRQYHLPPAQWARYLTPGLRGKALDAYVELSEEQGNDYEALKAAIIQKFQLTPEVYRKRFRSLQKGPGDSYLDVESRLRTTFRQWTKGLKADSFESLEDLMIEDQLLHICPTDVRQFVLERKPNSAKVAAELADTYIHSRVSDHRKAPPNGWKGGKSHMATPPPPANQVPQQMEPAVPGAKAFLTNNRTCYTCGKAGHLKAQCPEQKKLTSPGHPASNPSAVLCVSGKPPGTNANLQPVTVGHRTVIGLRDTGAEVTLVRPEVIEETDIIPEKFLTLTGVGGTLSCVPRAYVFIDWGAGSGMREVGVSEEIPTAVLLGADLGTLVSYYVPAKSTQDAPTELSGPTKVLCTDVGVISGQPVDGQREGEGEVEVQGPPYSETGEETPLLGKVTDTGSNDAAMINVKCDDADVDVDDNALPVLVVTRSAAKAAEVQALIAEQQEEVSGPSPCSDPADSTSVEPQQPSLFATGLLAGTCGTAFETALQTDQTLAQLRSSADRPPAENCKQKLYWEKGKLYREGLPAEGNESDTRSRQLVVPSQFRGQLLKVAHEIPLAGHLGITKTRGRLMHNFYWPTMRTDIADYCRSCVTCQRVGKVGDVQRAPLKPLPVIDEPFKRVAVDIIGPLAIPSSSGKRFILTVVDYATRYPEAVALSCLRTDKVADALLGIFTRVGFPAELISDQGPQFMSDLMQALCLKIQMTHIVASAYHPQTNGLCERFNGTLKQMLCTFVHSQGKDWERYLPHLLFAYREVPQESTGFSPFELLYGRRVRGPLDLIRETWEGKIADPEVSVVDYVLKFRDKMETLVGIVRENMTKAQTNQKQWYDRNARERTFNVGQQVYALLPLRKNKLQAAWEGPYTITQRLNDVTYLVRLGEGSRRQRAIHVNMLKAHHERTAYVMPVCSRPEPEEADPLLDLLADSREVDSELLINSKLTPTQVPGLKRVLAVHGSRFTGKPGRTHLAIHQVDTGTHPPIKQSAYRVSLEVLADMKREVEEMLQLGVIQKSHSAWASPVVLVPKKDRTTRFCVDYRKLNAITTADAYPMPRIDELLDRLAAAHYITIMDLSRGYWQIPLAPEAREKSAFITPFGLFEFTVMPFGMKNAPATFQRVMNDLLEGLEPFAVAYLDDIAVFSPTWEEHLMHLSQVLDRLTDANLTVKPSKCQIGMNDVHYLGHQVGGGTLKPETGKVEAILAWPIPQTKKQVMSFLGTAGYYRKFVGNYSSLAKPLTDLTKKKLPKVVSWTPECEQAFQALKEALASAPVLQAPDFTRRFLVQTDASAYGLGAVLSQVDDAGEEHPILYLSRKLLPREVAYATIEKECLAIVWSLQKLQTYLYGRHFTVITDHNPLSWLNRVAGENGKLLRWSLILQQYDFTIQHKKGSAHGNADGLSRQAEPAGVGCVRREIVVPSHATT